MYKNLQRLLLFNQQYVMQKPIRDKNPLTFIQLLVKYYQTLFQPVS